MEDQEIATAIHWMKNGDIQGLAVLVERFQVKAIRTAYLITKDPAMAEDIVQAAFIRIYKRIDSFDSNRPFTPWFMRIVANGAIAACRKENRVLSLHNKIGPNEDGATFLDMLTDEQNTPDLQAENAEVSEAIWRALDNLSPEQRAVIILRYYLDMSENEMSTHLNIPPGTIKWRLHAARKQLSFILRHFRRSTKSSEKIQEMRNGRG